MSYSLREAAKATGKSKPTIHRAIQKGKISAQRKADGSYIIDPAELHRVFPPVSRTGDRDSDLRQSETLEMFNETHVLRREIELLREMMTAQTAQLEDLKEDRDRWRQQATALLPDKQAAVAPQKPAGSIRFWPWSHGA